MADALPAVLVIEDSPEDFEATRRSLRRGGLANPIVHLPDGDRALDYLFAGLDGEPAARPVAPGLILLDLNLPGTDGRQVLTRVKADERLRQVPVVVLTTSRDERDVHACYRAGANSYIQKPVDLSGFQRALRTLREYWFDVVVLPVPD
jgi:two-component system, response regulator